MTKLFYTEKPIIGLDISSTGIKVMAIDVKRWLVLGYGSIDLDPMKIKESLEGNSTYLAENIQLMLKEKIIGALPSNSVAISIPTIRSYSRTFNLPLKVENELKNAIELEVDQFVPIPASTLYIDYQIIERSKKEITVLMSAVARTIIDKCVAAAEGAGLTVNLVEPGMSAVARLLANTEDGNLPSVIVDMGPANTDIAILDGGKIRVTGGVTVGGNTLTLDIAKKLAITLENANQLKVLNGLSAGPRQEKISRAVEPSLKQVIIETRKVIRYYNERINDDRKLEQLLVVGSGSNMPGVGEYFTNELIMPARVASPWQKLDFGKLQEPARQFRSRYITVAGLSSLTPKEFLGVINLLPYDMKKQTRAARMNVILLRYVVLMILAGVFLTLACIFTNYILSTSNNTAATDKNSSIVSPTNSQPVSQSELSNYSTNISTAKSILARQITYSDVVLGIASCLPEGSIIKSISLNDGSYNASISLLVLAKSNDIEPKLKDNFQKSSLFTDYKIQPSTSTIESDSDYPVTINVNVSIKKGNAI